MVTAETYQVFWKFYSCKKSILRNTSELSIEKFPSLLLFRNARMLRTPLLSNFCSIVCQMVAHERLKRMKKFKLLALKVVAVAYDRWSLTRGSKYSDLTWKLLVFCKSGRLRDIPNMSDLTLLFLDGVQSLYFELFWPRTNLALI